MDIEKAKILKTILKAVMLITFGVSWPVSIIKSIKSGTTRGKNAFSLIAIEIGYISGIIYKFTESRDWVMYLYILNFFFVAIDLVFTFKNKQLDLKKDLVRR